jgi:hypothetical protein
LDEDFDTSDVQIERNINNRMMVAIASKWEEDPVASGL